MTQEQKDLLIKDLCARLPYRVKVHDTKNSVNVPYMNLCHVNGIINEVFISSGAICRTAPIEDVKPYLFPLSSMTEEQKEELDNIFNQDDDVCEKIKTRNFEFSFFRKSIFDFLNKHHFDWRGLIPKGLANDATGKNIY